jgi:DNA-binding MurR/RpiR family transcriptional regulator
VSTETQSDSAVVPHRLDELFAGSRLTPVQRRIAAHIAEHGSRVAFNSSVELAEQVGVSQPSVTRLATALGFSGFAELQRAIQEIVLDRHEQAGQTPLNKMQRAVQHSIDTLVALQDGLGDTVDLKRAAAKLAKASGVLVYGSRASIPLAQQFSVFAARIRPQVWRIEGPHTVLCDYMADARQDGEVAMLAIVLPPYPREAFRVLKSANALGIEVIGITDSLLSPVADLCNVVLPAQVNPDLVFDAAVAPAQVLVLLLEALADVKPNQTRKRLEEFEDVAAREGYFLEQ